jgi:hypothetical protein
LVVAVADAAAGATPDVEQPSLELGWTHGVYRHLLERRNGIFPSVAFGPPRVGFAGREQVWFGAPHQAPLSGRRWP